VTYVKKRADAIFESHPQIDSKPDKQGDSKKVPLDSLLTVWFNPWQHQFEEDPIFPLIDAVRREQSSKWAELKSGLKKIVEDPKFRIIGKASLGVMSMEREMMNRSERSDTKKNENRTPAMCVHARSSSDELRWMRIEWVDWRHAMRAARRL
jgi:hypothetical protein